MSGISGEEVSFPGAPTEEFTHGRIIHRLRPRSKIQARGHTSHVEQPDEKADIEGAMNMWRPSPSPEESFSDAEGANEDGEWPLKIVGEEVTHYGDVKYEVRWGNWSRPDGSNTTWDNRLIPADIIQVWDRKQRLRRAARAKRSHAIQIPGTLCVTDMMSFVRSQALQEIVEAEDTSTLRQAIEKGMTDTSVSLRDTAVNRVSPSPCETPATFRNLFQSVKRSLRQNSSIVKLVDKAISSTPPQSPRKRRRIETSPELGASAGPRQGSPEVDDNVSGTNAVKYECNDLIVAKKTHSTRSVRVEGLCEGPADDQTPSPPMISKRRKTIKQYPNRRDRLATQWSNIAKAAGAAQITFTNEVDDDIVPKLVQGFTYIEAGYRYSDDVPKSEELEESLFVRCHCKSCRDPGKCDCQSISDLVDAKGTKRIAYDTEGLFAIDVTPGLMVIECNKCCRCDISCQNRVSQRPRKVPIDIFKTTDRGWGARPLCDVRKGTVLGMYTGNLVRRREAEQLDGEERGFCFDLDGQENLYGDGSDQLQAYSVDSRMCGNWTRFINHSCSPNLQVYQVVHDTIPEMKTPYIFFCALDDIPSNCEFTVDYDPSDLEDRTTQKRKGKGKKGKKKNPDGSILCKCGEESCRKWVRVLA